MLAICAPPESTRAIGTSVIAIIDSGSIRVFVSLSFLPRPFAIRQLQHAYHSDILLRES